MTFDKQCKKCVFEIADKFQKINCPQNLRSNSGRIQLPLGHRGFCVQFSFRKGLIILFGQFAMDKYSLALCISTHLIYQTIYESAFNIEKEKTILKLYTRGYIP